MAISRVGPPSQPVVTTPSSETHAPAKVTTPPPTGVPAKPADGVDTQGIPPSSTAAAPGALDGVPAEGGGDGVNALLEQRGALFADYLMKDEGFSAEDAKALAAEVTQKSELEAQGLKDPDEETLTEIFDKNADAAMAARDAGATEAPKSLAEQAHDLADDLRGAERDRAELEKALKNGPAEIAGDEKQVSSAKEKLVQDQAKLRDAEVNKAPADVIARLRSEVQTDKRALFGARHHLFSDKQELESLKKELPEANAAVARAKTALETFKRDHSADASA
jgi:hypothetical protein